MENQVVLDKASLKMIDELLCSLQICNTIGGKDYIKLNQDSLEALCRLSIQILKEESTLLKINTPIHILGDIHGQFYDMMKFFGKDEDGASNKVPMLSNANHKPIKYNYLFLGDYVDRGQNSVACITYLLALKCMYPESVFLLRGNHETRELSKIYGFYEEVHTYYEDSLWDLFNEVFGYMPLAAVISDKIFCVHGGLSQTFHDLSQITALTKPIDVPETGFVADLLWADPDPETEFYKESERGTSFSFGERAVNDFLAKNSYDLVCRAHQVVDDGFEFPFYPSRSVITLFSAPNYCEDCGNKAAMMMVDQDLKCSFYFI